MDPARIDPPPHPRAEPDRGAVDASAAVMAAAARGEAPEEALVAGATRAEGPGCARAWLLAFEPRTERLAGVALAADGAASAPGGDEVRGWRAVQILPARLDPLGAAAWAGAGAEVGPVGSVALPWGGSLAGAIALRRGGRRWGLLVGVWTAAGDARARAAALEAHARFAEAALSVRDTACEARRRARQTDALAELAAVAGASAHLAEALRAAARLAAQATGSEVGVVWRAGPDGAPRLEVTHGAPGRRERVADALAPLAAAAIAGRRPIVLDRALDERRLAADAAATLGALVVVPLEGRARALGALAVVDPAADHAGDPRVFDAGDLRFLGALAALAAQAADRAAGDAALRDAEQRHRELRTRLAREERLAALGEAALRTAQEARHPLASIAAFARRVHRALADGDAQRESLEIVLREVARLERLLGQALAEAPPEPPRLQVESVNAALQAALQAAGETLVRRRVRLVKRLAPDLPALLLDGERVRRVIDNILAFALDAVPVGGRVRVESRRLGALVQVEVAHDGPRAPGDLMEHLFVPFAGGEAPAGGEVGLGVASRIIREHGGEIRVRTEGDWTNVVSFTLPVALNQDRRGADGDRRKGRSERRRAAG